MIHNLLHLNLQHNIILDASVYCIPCKDCNSKYIGETSRNIHKYVYEHRRDIRIGNLNNSLLQHISKSDHNFDFNAATMLAYIHNKRLRQIFKASAISICRNDNNHPGFLNILPYLGKLILNSYKIFHV